MSSHRCWMLVLLLCLLGPPPATTDGSLEMEERLLERPRLGARLQYDPVSGSTLAHYVSRQRRSYRLRPPEMFSSDEQRRYGQRLRAIRRRQWPAERRRRAAQMEQFRGAVAGLLHGYRGLVKLMVSLVAPVELESGGGDNETTVAARNGTGDRRGGDGAAEARDSSDGVVSNSTESPDAREPPSDSSTVTTNFSSFAAGGNFTTAPDTSNSSPAEEPDPAGPNLSPDPGLHPDGSLLQPVPPPTAAEAAADADAVRTLSRFFGALLDGGAELRQRLTEAGDSEPASVRRAARRAFETLWRRVTAPPGSVRTAADQADERRAAGVFWGLMEQFLEERGTTGRRRVRRHLDLGPLRDWLGAGPAGEAVLRFTTDHRPGGGTAEDAIVGNIGINWTAIGQWIADSAPAFDDFTDGDGEEQPWSWDGLLRSLVEQWTGSESSENFVGPFDWMNVYQTVAELFFPELSKRHGSNEADGSGSDEHGDEEASETNDQHPSESGDQDPSEQSDDSREYDHRQSSADNALDLTPMHENPVTADQNKQWKLSDQSDGDFAYPSDQNIDQEPRDSPTLSSSDPTSDTSLR